MRSVAVLLTFATFCVHAVFGCCTHHVHAETGDGGCHHEHAAAHDDQACEHADRHACDHADEHLVGASHVEGLHDCSTHSHSPLHSSCEGASCTFLTVSKSTRASDEVVAAQVCATLSGPTPFEVSTVPAELARVAEVPIGPPIPLYLFHQAILA